MATITESVGGHLGKDVEMTSDVERAATGDAGRFDGRVHRTSLANKEANKNDATTRSDLSENGKKKTKEEKPPSKNFCEGEEVINAQHKIVCGLLEGEVVDIARNHVYAVILQMSALADNPHCVIGNISKALWIIFPFTCSWKEWKLQTCCGGPAVLQQVVIRRLPPSMTKDVFISQISPVPEHDYFYFVPGDPSAGNLIGFSRAYINFINQEDLFLFTETYDNYVFVDSKGQEYPAIVEFAPFQRIPKQRSKKKDPLSGCIETDPLYISFKESLEAAAADAAKPDVTSKQHFFETEVTPSAPQEMATTPLLEFLKQKRADRARIRDERKEERKRKEVERKLRQKAIKEKKETEEEHKDIKLLQPKDKKESNNKESRNGRRPEKDKPPKEIRPREFRNRSNKNISEDKSRAEKKEDRKKDAGGADKVDDKRDPVDKEVKEEPKEKVADDTTNGNVVSDRAKVGGGDRRRGGGERKKYGEGEGGEESTKKNRNERNRSVRKERERKRRDDYLAKKNLEKRNNEGTDKKKSRSHRNSNNGAMESGGVSDSKDKNKEEKEAKDGIEELKDVSSRLMEREDLKQDTVKIDQTQEKSTSKNSVRRSSFELTPEANNTSSEIVQLKRRNSLESGSVSEFSGHKGSSRRHNRGSDRKREKHDSVDDKRGAESDSGGEKRRSREEKASKSDQDDPKKDEKDTRAGRRIRNKDRPSIQIYRPGMGKLSKQRLEKEKTLGSSTEVDSPSHSPSPVPKTKPPAPS